MEKQKISTSTIKNGVAESACSQKKKKAKMFKGYYITEGLCTFVQDVFA